MQDSPSNTPPGISRSMQDFKAAIETLSESVKLLEKFSGDYFMTLNQSGFSELHDIVETLCQTYEISISKIKSGKFDEANDILRYAFLKKGQGDAPDILKSQLAYYFPFLASWSDRFAKTVVVIDKNIKESSKKFQAVGAMRKRDRNPTSMILGEVRKNILNGDFGDIKDKKKSFSGF